MAAGGVVARLCLGVPCSKPRDGRLHHHHFERVLPSLLRLQEVDKCLADGADEYLQLVSLCALVMQQLTQNT